jgi:hypothetical protein
MRSLLRSREWKLSGLVLAVLVLAVGFCVFDGDEYQDGHAGLDLCLSMLATSLAVTLVSRLPLTGMASPDRLAALFEFLAPVPAPPPKTAFS